MTRCTTSTGPDPRASRFSDLLAALWPQRPALLASVVFDASIASVDAVLDPLEGLTAAETDAGGDYFTVMRENLQALRKALGCR